LKLTALCDDGHRAAKDCHVKNPRWSACFGHFKRGFLVGFQFNHSSSCGGLLSEQKHQQ
jgi:hypothetical protein